MGPLKSAKRLLVLDIDHTLINVPLYDPLIEALTKDGASAEEFYQNLPDGGVFIEAGSPTRVYPRPHLLSFLEGAEALGYELALCTTATKAYVRVVLPLCGVDLSRFVAVITQEALRHWGGKRMKDIAQFTALGYSPDNIVAIDDSTSVYLQPEHVFQISPFLVTGKGYIKDSALPDMLHRLAALGGRSLLKIRQHRQQHFQRERLIRDVSLAAFDSKKYKNLSSRPHIFDQRCADLDHHQGTDPPPPISLDHFLIFKDFGLVGDIRKVGKRLKVTNYCPEAWRDVPPDVSIIKLSGNLLNRLYCEWDREWIQNLCRFLGYTVDRDDVLTLAAISMQPTHTPRLHILAHETSVPGLASDALDVYSMS
ncbi:HAD family hydrolase [Gilvimarinus algae]|uniref:HAD family hydrolase n=1 Tax=Gilvimarinus algae TaxID=3058037 RepID=A0ABT8TE54_9GAMM|nr:HAD family hydrolase [Gilvimarinus sp. SDUM040014]MDO3382384.1 HAD family hydrolase [Gilvimarinus sp. SDUM040014]